MPLKQWFTKVIYPLLTNLFIESVTQLICSEAQIHLRNSK